MLWDLVDGYQIIYIPISIYFLYKLYVQKFLKKQLFIIENINKTSNNGYIVSINYSSLINIKPGQHISISYKNIKRKYTPINIINYYNSSQILLAIKKYPCSDDNMNMSTYITSSEIGDELNIVGPIGNIFLENNLLYSKNKVYNLDTENTLMISMGSGITPLYSIANTYATAKKNNIKLLHIDRTKEDIIILDRLNQLSELININFFYTSIYGRIKGNIIVENFKNNNISLVLLCGTYDFCEFIKNICISNEIQLLIL